MHPDREPSDSDPATLLSHLDHPVPEVSLDDVWSRAQGREPRRWRHSWAAGVILALGVAGVAYAAPGSPIPRWIRALTERDGVDAGAPTAQAEDLRGLSFGAGEPLLVEIAPSSQPYSLRVTLTDDAAILVGTSRDDTEFDVRPNGVRVQIAPEDMLHVRLPRGAARVEVVGQGRTLFLWDGVQIRTEASREADGSLLLRVVPPAP
ncbi:MAG: hypothetical protein WEG36_00810 [Gemmatimonadota bacterium]